MRIQRKDRLENYVINKIMREALLAKRKLRRESLKDYWIRARNQGI